MEFIRKSGITVTCSPAAVLGANHIKRNKAAKTLFLKRRIPLNPLYLSQNTSDVCLSLAGVQKYAIYF